MGAPRSSGSLPPRFTKGDVNRAGEQLLDVRERLFRGPAGSAFELGQQLAVEDEDLEQAWEALRWWRTLHARPLSKVAANLRYHVDQEGGLVNERIDVTQRLKRMDTMIDKLAREEGRLTQMHDIGGVPVGATELARRAGGE
jgi:hypothetical protein